MKCENCFKTLTLSGWYQHRQMKCIPQSPEVPECLICRKQFVKIHARNKHYRKAHSVTVDNLACFPGERDAVLMKLIRDHHPSSPIEQNPDDSINKELMKQIKSSPISRFRSVIEIYKFYNGLFEILV